MATTRLPSANPNLATQPVSIPPAMQLRTSAAIAAFKANSRDRATRICAGRVLLAKLAMEQDRLLAGVSHVGPFYMMLDHGLGAKMRMAANACARTLDRAQAMQNTLAVNAKNLDVKISHGTRTGVERERLLLWQDGVDTIERALSSFEKQFFEATEATKAFARDRGLTLDLPLVVAAKPEQPRMALTVETPPVTAVTPTPPDATSSSTSSSPGAASGTSPGLQPTDGKTSDVAGTSTTGAQSMRNKARPQKKTGRADSKSQKAEAQRNRLKKLLSSPASPTPPPKTSAPTASASAKPGVKTTAATPVVVPVEQRAKVRPLADIQAQATTLLKAGRNDVDWGEMLMEWEAATRIDISQAQYDRAQATWQALRQRTDVIMKNTALPMADRVNAVAQMLVEKSQSGVLRKYVFDQASILGALLGEGANCEGQTKVLSGLLAPYGVSGLGVQTYGDHVQAVLFDAASNEVTNILANTYRVGVETHIYEPRLLAFSMNKLGAKREGIAVKDLLLAAADPRLSDAQRKRAMVPPGGRFTSAMIDGESQMNRGGVVPEKAMLGAPTQQRQLTNTATPLSPNAATPSSTSAGEKADESVPLTERGSEVDPDQLEPHRSVDISDDHTIYFRHEAHQRAYASLETAEERRHFLASVIATDLQQPQARQALSRAAALLADPTRILDGPLPSETFDVTSALDALRDVSKDGGGEELFSEVVAKIPELRRLQSQSHAFVSVATRNPRALVELISSANEPNAEHLHQSLYTLWALESSQDKHATAALWDALGAPLASAPLRKGASASEGTKPVAAQPLAQGEKSQGATNQGNVREGGSEKPSEGRRATKSDEGMSPKTYIEWLSTVLAYVRSEPEREKINSAIGREQVNAILAEASAQDLVGLVDRLLHNPGTGMPFRYVEGWIKDGPPSHLLPLLRAARQSYRATSPSLATLLAVLHETAAP